MKHLVRILLLALGSLLFIGLVWRVGPDQLIEGMRKLGVGFLAVIALGGVGHMVKTLAWRFTLKPEQRPRFLQMVGVRLAGEAVAQLSFGGQVFGETTRALLLKRAHEIPLVRGVSSVVIDRGMFTFIGFLMIVTGAVTASAMLGLPEEAQRFNALVAVIFICVIATAVFALRQRWRFFSRPFGALARIGRLRGTVEKRMGGVREIEATIHSFYHDSPKAFWSCFACSSAGHGMNVLEVYCILQFLGLDASLLDAFVIESLTKIVNFSSAVIPGGVGAYEGGQMLILKMMGLGSANGLTVGIARRIRNLTWTAAGLLVLFWHGISLKRLQSEAEGAPSKAA